MPLVRKPPPSSPVSTPATSAFDALSNGTDEERWAGARAVSELPGGLRALSEALGRERNPRVREAIFTAFARNCTPESVELILPYLRSDDAHIRAGTLDALRAMKSAVEPHISRLLHDEDSDVRLLACELARNLPNGEASHFLCELLASEPEPNVCASAVEVLAEVGGPEALTVLATCAERFRGIAFIEFSIKTTADRIQSQTSQRRE